MDLITLIISKIELEVHEKVKLPMKKVLETEKNGLTMDLATLAKVCTGDKTMDNELTTGVWGPSFQLSVDSNMKKKKTYNILHLHCHSKAL